MIYVCSECGARPTSRVDTTGVDENGFATVEKLPVICPTPDCVYHDPRNIDGDWLVVQGA